MQRLKHPVSIFLGIGISLASLWFAIRNIKWAETADAIRTLDLTQLAFAMSFLIVGLFLRGERWRIIIARSVTKISVYRATMLGFFFNYVYPARAGDVIKIVSLQRSSGISIGWLGVSGIVDRLIDVLVLLLAAVMLMKALPSLNLGSTFFFLTSSALVLLVVLGFSPLGEQTLFKIDQWLVHGHRQTRWRALLKRALDGLLFYRRGMVHGRRLCNLTGASVLVALADYGSIFFLLSAFGWQLPYVSPVVIWVFISAGSALPSAPAGIGIHQLACVMALKIYGISASNAFAFSVILQTGSFVAILLALLSVYGYSFNRNNILHNIS